MSLVDAVGEIPALSGRWLHQIAYNGNGGLWRNDDVRVYGIKKFAERDYR